MSQNFTPNPQIHAVFPSNKIGLFIDDCTHLRKPKIRIALVPTAQGEGEAVEFFMDLAVARVFFEDLKMGSLPNDALFKEIPGKNGKVNVFDLFAKIPPTEENPTGGHRSLTASNLPDGLYLKIVKKNGAKATQAASFSSFQTRVLGQAVSAYITQLDLIALYAQSPNAPEAAPETLPDDFPG